MGSLAGRLSRFAAIIGVSILAISSLVWLIFHTEGFTQPIDVLIQTPTPLPSPTPTFLPGTPTPAPSPSFFGLSAGPPTALLFIAGLLALLLLLLLLLVFARGRRRGQPVTTQRRAPAEPGESGASQTPDQPVPAHGQPAMVIIQQSSRGDTVLNVTIGLVTTIAGAIIGHYWH
jgi:hypothetical protein